MPIEIRELLIKVKIEEPLNSNAENLDIEQMKLSILKECRKEIKKQLNNYKER